MGHFTLTFDPDLYDGSPSSDQDLIISAVIPPGTDLVGPEGQIYDRSMTVRVTGGTLSVQLPADDVAPYAFGYLVREGTRGRRWKVPVQPVGFTRDLHEFAATTELPMAPDADVLIAQLLARVAVLEDLVANPPAPPLVEDPPASGLYLATTTEDPAGSGLYPSPTNTVEDPPGSGLYLIGA